MEYFVSIVSMEAWLYWLAMLVSFSGGFGIGIAVILKNNKENK